MAVYICDDDDGEEQGLFVLLSFTFPIASEEGEINANANMQITAMPYAVYVHAWKNPYNCNMLCIADTLIKLVLISQRRCR